MLLGVVRRRLRAGLGGEEHRGQRENRNRKIRLLSVNVHSRFGKPRFALAPHTSTTQPKKTETMHRGAMQWGKPPMIGFFKKSHLCQGVNKL